MDGVQMQILNSVFGDDAVIYGASSSPAPRAGLGQLFDELRVFMEFGGSDERFSANLERGRRIVRKIQRAYDTHVLVEYQAFLIQTTLIEPAFGPAAGGACSTAGAYDQILALHSAQQAMSRRVSALGLHAELEEFVRAFNATARALWREGELQAILLQIISSELMQREEEGRILLNTGIIGQLQSFIAYCRDLGFKPELKAAISTSIANITCAIVRAGCRNNFDVSGCRLIRTGLLKDLIDVASKLWFAALLKKDFSASVVSEQLYEIAEDELVAIRTQDIIDIVSAIPSSEVALLDLKSCLRTTKQRAQFVESFRKACQKSFLHSGANTVSVLAQYIRTIKAMLVIDPRGVLLDRVSVAFRDCLRLRDDTIRCIMTSILGGRQQESDSELVDEDFKLENIDIEEEAEDYGLSWEPDPIDAAPNFKKPSQRLDIVGSLVSIYDSKEVFIKELQALLSERLLSSNEVDIEVEYKNLDLLKIRFGESNLSMCEVMLRDFEQSEALNMAFKQAHPELLEDRFVATVLSKLYWPNLRGDAFELPAEIKKLQSEFVAAYEASQKNRSLTWVSGLGRVGVDLELEDRTLSMIVTPLQAAIIGAFQETPRLRLDDITSLLQVSRGAAKRDTTFWVKHNVLHETACDEYTVLERASEAAPVVGVAADDAMQTLAVARESEDMQIYGQFVTGMLTNIGAMDLSRIHMMLGMFVPPPNSYNKSPAELETLLHEMMEAERIELSGGMYRLKEQ